MSQQQAQSQRETPKYRLEECAYINDVMYEKEAVIEWRGIPGWHMEPVNDAARAMKDKHPSVRPDPIADLTSLKVSDTSVGELVTVLAQALKQAKG